MAKPIEPKAPTTKKKKAAKPKPPSAKGTENVVPIKESTVPAEPKVVKPRKEKPLPDTSDALPEKIKDKKVLCRQVVSATVTTIEMNDIKATTKAVYVDDIHHANPTTLQTIHWVILKNHTIVIARVDEAQYENIVKARPKMRHLVSVVDCSVVPTVSYGSWTKDQLVDDFPSPKQIKEADAALKNNPAFVHNPPVKLELAVEETLEAPEEETIDLVDDTDEIFDLIEEDGAEEDGDDEGEFWE